MTTATQLDSKISAAILDAIQQHGLPENFVDTVDSYYRPLASEIAAAAKHSTNESESPLLLGIFGSQGSGKSTFADFLKLLLTQQWNTSCVVMSLDDFYLTRDQRNNLSKTVHPLLRTRGVPGTHDINLLNDTINQLSHFSGKNTVRVPTFNKAIDDRAEPKDWQTISAKPSVIVLEGWCVGVKPQQVADLVAPVNDLEKNMDADGHWRKFVNDNLADHYIPLFERLDKLIALIVPSFDCVHEWRSLQEEKLIKALSAQGASTKATMSAEQIGHFITHYQRLTEHALTTLPDYADWCMNIDKYHTITSLTSRKQR